MIESFVTIPPEFLLWLEYLDFDYESDFFLSKIVVQQYHIIAVHS